MKKLTAMSSALLITGLLAAQAHAADRHDISGMVRDADNNAMRDVRVRLYKSMGDGRDPKMLAETSTDKKGKFHFDKVEADDNYLIDAHKDTLHAIRHVDISDGSVDDMQITMHEGKDTGDIVSGAADGYTTIDGIVRDDNKAAIGGATVRLLGRIKGTDRLKELDAVSTARNGFFEFYKVADGTFTIEVSDGGHAIQREITIKSGEHMDRLEMTFHRG